VVEDNFAIYVNVGSRKLRKWWIKSKIGVGLQRPCCLIFSHLVCVNWCRCRKGGCC